MNQPSTVPSVMALVSSTTLPSAIPFAQGSWIVLVQSSGATAGLPRVNIEDDVGTVSPVTISTLQPKPFSRMMAWICAKAAAEGQVISAISMVRSVPQLAASVACGSDPWASAEWLVADKNATAIAAAMPPDLNIIG